MVAVDPHFFVICHQPVFCITTMQLLCLDYTKIWVLTIHY